jgi:hypothetical protein
MGQSRELRKAIDECPLAKECESQMKQGNNLLPACRNVTEIANRLDQFNLTLNYTNVPINFLSMSYRAYTVFRHLLFPYMSEDIFPLDSPQNGLRINVTLNTNSTALNITIKAPAMDVNFTDVRLSPLEASLFQLNPDSTVLERIGKKMSPLFSQRKFISSYTFILVYLSKR